MEEVEKWKVEQPLTNFSTLPLFHFSTFVTRIVFVLVVLATAWSLALPRRAVSLPALPADFTAPVRGAIHIHTRRSDGTGTVDDVAAAAERAGLSFIVVTDHGDGMLPPELPAYRGRVLVIDAVEISTEGGHIVALGMKPAPYPLGGEPRDVIEDVKRLDGFVIAAHPASAKPELQWTDWSLPIDGLEWVNGDSEWRDESAFSLVRTLLTYPGRGRESLAALLDYPEQLMERWDALNAGRRVIAIAAADAHARIGFRNLGEPYDRRALLPLPSYETVFSTFSIALPDVALTGNASADAAAVLDAIRRGQLYSTVDALAGPGALSFAAVDRTVLRARIHAQPDARIVLFKDGHELKTAFEGALEHDAAKEPGVYRVEVRLTGSPGAPPVPWIVSNAISLGRPAGAEPAAARPRQATEFKVQYRRWTGHRLGGGAGSAVGWRDRSAGGHARNAAGVPIRAERRPIAEPVCRNGDACRSRDRQVPIGSCSRPEPAARCVCRCNFAPPVATPGSAGTARYSSTPRRAKSRCSSTT